MRLGMPHHRLPAAVFAGLIELVELPGAVGGGGHQVIRFDLHQVGSPQIGQGQITEDEIEHRGCDLDVVVSLNDSVGLETGEHEGVHILFQGHPVLQAQGYGNGEAVEQAAEGGSLPMHVQEDLPQAPVRILAGAQEKAVPADLGLLGVAAAAAGQRPAIVLRRGHLRRGTPIHCRSVRPGCGLLLDSLLARSIDAQLIGAPPSPALQGQDLFGQTLSRRAQGGQRLAELRSIPIDGDGFEHPFPGQEVGALDILHAHVVGHVHGLGDRAGYERLDRRHHLDVGLPGDETGTDAAHLAGRVEHGVMLGLEVRGALHGHRAAGMAVGLLDLLLAESQVPQQLEARLVVGSGIQAELLLKQLLANYGGHES